MLVLLQSPPHQHSLVFSTISWPREQMIVHKSENQSKNSRAADIGGSHNSFLNWQNAARSSSDAQMGLEQPTVLLRQFINNSFQYFKNRLEYININFQYFSSRFLNIYSTTQMSLVAKTKNVLSRVQVGANISSQTNFIVRNQVSGKTVRFFLTSKSFKN